MTNSQLLLLIKLNSIRSNKFVTPNAIKVFFVKEG